MRYRDEGAPGRRDVIGCAPVTVELSVAEARRIALGAQGFGERRPTGRVGIAHVRRVANRLRAFQIDSVNVLVRAHYVPAFSRLGPYPVRAVDELVYERREMFEYIAHAACFIPMSLYPLCRWRMEANLDAPYWRNASAAGKRYVEAIYADVAERGPLPASELKDAGKSKGNWWGWSDGKAAIETLWRMGRVAIAGRRGFERVYDITERVIPADVLSAPAVPADEAVKQILVLSTHAMGIGTAQDIAKYFWIDRWWERPSTGGERTRSRVPRLMHELVDEGRLSAVRVEGWKPPAYVAPKTRVPNRIEASAIVSPFDPLMWERKWTKAVFGFDYKIEIYVPAPKRQYGYYVLPFLLGERLVARVDLKADRKRGVLLVPGAFRERSVDRSAVAAALAAELRLIAEWLELDRIEVGRKGDLARELGRALK